MNVTFMKYMKCENFLDTELGPTFLKLDEKFGKFNIKQLSRNET